MTKAKYTEENWQLYKLYVNEVHEKEKDEDGVAGYKRWLCSQNLHYETLKDPNSGITLEMGAYHMNYYLDGKLVAVGVIDILDQGLSTVYCFYDPSLKRLNFGVVSALYEIEWIKEKMLHFPDFRKYYLGFWIHDCEKMSYKSDYEPIELLCPLNLIYVPLDKDLKSRIAQGKVNLIEPGEPKDDYLRELEVVKNRLAEREQFEFKTNQKQRMMQYLINGSIDMSGETVRFMELTKTFFEQISGLFDDLWTAMGIEAFKNTTFTL